MGHIVILESKSSLSLLIIWKPRVYSRVFEMWRKTQNKGFSASLIEDSLFSHLEFLSSLLRKISYWIVEAFLAPLPVFSKFPSGETFSTNITTMTDFTVDDFTFNDNLFDDLLRDLNQDGAANAAPDFSFAGQERIFTCKLCFLDFFLLSLFYCRHRYNLW